MPPITYIPYGEAHTIPSDELIVVDCHYPRGLVLAHVYEERSPNALQGNCSTDTVLNWLALPDDEKRTYLPNPRFATCNHFDIDGFLALWCLLNPEEALRNGMVLRTAALLGDFREFDDTTELGLEALKLCAIINHVEAANFCLPFGNLTAATIEYQVSHEKFPYFLPRFSEWLRNPDAFAEFWRAEYDEVMTDLAFIRSHQASFTEMPDLDMTIIEAPRPLHYYAAFSNVRSGAVLTHLTSINYFEFEYRYETRVRRVDKQIRERRDLSGVADALNALENSATILWKFDNLYEGGPMLRPEYVDRPLTYEHRYQSLGYRVEKGLCPTSSLTLEALTATLRPTLCGWGL